MTVLVDLFRTFGLITGDLVSTDGQLEPSYARFKGCASAGQGCHQLPIDEASPSSATSCEAGPSGSRCPIPSPRSSPRSVRPPASRASPQTPRWPCSRSRTCPRTRPVGQDRQHVATLLDLPEDQVPDLRLTWCHVRRGPQGEPLGSCPKVPADLEAKVSYHIDTQEPSAKERLFGSQHQKTTAINQDLGLELPLGTSTYPANAEEGTHFIVHRAALAMPVLPGQVQLGDAASDVSANDLWLRAQGGVPVCDDNRRRENLAPEPLVERGYAQHGTPYAPCGRLCRSNGSDDQADSRQYVCGRPCSPQERKRCPHGSGVRGSSHRMIFTDHPRLIGPIQRGTSTWHRFYAVRTASERTNSDDQAVVGGGHPPRLRGLGAFRFAGALRTLAQLLRQALNFVLDVTSTLNRRQLIQT
jgi:hypothetical protein